jgi:hypothetical protein
MERISYAACEETTCERGSDVVNYQGKNYKIACFLLTKEKVREILFFGQKIAKIKNKGKNIAIIGFEE